MTTKFSEKYKAKTDSELLEIVENVGSYQKEAVSTAIFELELRGITNEEITTLKNKIQSQIEVGKQQLANENKIPADLPNTISIAVKMIYLSIALGIVNPIIVELTTDVQNLSTPINLAIVLISTGTLTFFGYNINLGKNWARMIFTILVGLGLLLFPLVIPETFRLNPLVGFLSVVQAILQGFAIIFIFKSESKTWYKKRKEELDKNTRHKA